MGVGLTDDTLGSLAVEVRNVGLVNKLLEEILESVVLELQRKY